jgi:imidazolonepropionase-like amidohydrolase
VDSQVGSLTEGKQADILITQGNPITRFDQRVLTTIVAGKLCYRYGERKKAQEITQEVTQELLPLC